MSRECKATATLLRQVNESFPHRSKMHDGGIGDTYHQHETSGHNPDSTGVFVARDFTHDPANGFDCHEFAMELTTNPDRRLLVQGYVIWNGRIWSGGHWADYHGVSKHTDHCHVSVGHDTYPNVGSHGDARLYDNPAEWEALQMRISDDDIERIAQRASDLSLHKIRGTENYSPSGHTGGPFTFFDSFIREIRNRVAHIEEVVTKK